MVSEMLLDNDNVGLGTKDPCLEGETTDKKTGIQSCDLMLPMAVKMDHYR